LFQLLTERSHNSGLNTIAFIRVRGSVLTTVSGGEFDWGGTSVKR
jgi:hypothetical protein